MYIVTIKGAQLPNETDLKTTLNSISETVLGTPKTLVELIRRGGYATGTPLTNISFEGDKMSHGGSGITSPYNTDQKTIINAYELEDETRYLFFVSEVVDRSANISETVLGTPKTLVELIRRGGYAGYMPLKYQCGFIYGLPNNNTIAHELGHGTFNLYHTFSPENNIAPEGTTQNLMDYAGGTELWHYQWDLIHDPESMWLAALQDESEAEYSTDGHYYTVQLVALMMGFTEQEALKLAIGAEEPDSYVEVNNLGSLLGMEARLTYANPDFQQAYHTLTGRKHGIELALTAYAYLRTDIDDLKVEKYLLHRFGDCFGHINTNETNFNTTISIETYANAMENLLNEYVVPKIKSVKNDYLINFINHDGNADSENMGNLKIYFDGNYLLTILSEEETKKALIKQLLMCYIEDFSTTVNTHNNFLRITVIDELETYLPNAVQNNYLMYGNDYSATKGHLFAGSTPDQIGVRRDLYLYYIHKLMELLTIEYNKSATNIENIKAQIKTIIDASITIGNNIRLDGILAFEIEYFRSLNKSDITFTIQREGLDKEDIEEQKRILEKYLENSDIISLKGKYSISHILEMDENTLTFFIVK